MPLRLATHFFERLFGVSILRSRRARAADRHGGAGGVPDAAACLAASEHAEARHCAGARLGRGSRVTSLLRLLPNTFRIVDVLVNSSFTFHLPKTMLRKLPFNASHLRPSSMIMRAFDGTRRNIIGHGYEHRMGLGKNNDGVASLVEIKENREKFRLGYKPTWADMRRSILERRNRGTS